MTSLVIDELNANDSEEGRLVAKTLVRLAKEGNASMLKLLYDRVEPQEPFTDEELEQLTPQQRYERVLAFLERAAARRDLPATRS